jgi:hypothetical protein
LTLANAARNTQLTAAELVTSLSLSAMASGVSHSAIALGIVVAGLGYALLGLLTPDVARRFGLQPAAA